jgi:hypothetical protein
MNSYIKMGFVLSLVISPAFLLSMIIRVPSDQATIQAGINASQNNDTVVVYPGRYLENINFNGKKIVLTSRFYERYDTLFIASTIIDGSSPVNTDSASAVRIVNHEDSITVLQGFTITGGTGTNWTDEHGAGVYREGGGILIALSSPIIKNNILINNIVSKNSKVTSAGGGGIRAGDGNPKILNNIIVGNTGRYGAGIVLNYTGAVLRNNIITRNSGGQDYGGGALWMNHDGPAVKIIENNTFAWNDVLAVYVWQGASTMRNCIIWRDSITSTVQILAKSGGPTVTYSNVQGGWTGEGNISSNPQFSDNSFHLNIGSPCIDAGDTAAEYKDFEDSLLPGSALWPSRGGLRNDIGAYGGQGAGEFPKFIIPTEIFSLKHVFPNISKLDQNYPNPFNPSTKITFTVATSSYTSLRIYDILGREIAGLIDGKVFAGEHSVQWQADNLPGGVYFYRLRNGNFSETKKLVLLK